MANASSVYGGSLVSAFEQTKVHHYVFCSCSTTRFSDFCKRLLRQGSECL